MTWEERHLGGLTSHQKNELDRHITGNYGEDFFGNSYEPDEEWFSACCGAPPHESTPDVGEDNQAGICGQCREHCGFERGEP